MNFFHKRGAKELLFGLVFFLFGSFLIFFTIGGFPLTIPFILFGMPFSLIGFWYLFGRTGVEIDKQREVVRSWWGILLSKQYSSKPLGQFSEVRIKIILEDENSSNTFKVIFLGGSADEIEITRFPEDDYMGARRTSEQIAKFLNFRIVDSSLSQEIVREPDTLDESIRERALREGEVVSLPEIPTNCSISFSLSDNCASGFFHLPERGISFELILVGISLSMSILFIVHYFGPFFSIFSYLFLGIFLFFLICTFRILAQGFSQTKSLDLLAVSKEGVIHETRGFFWKSKQTFSGMKIEEVLVIFPKFFNDEWRIFRNGFIAIRTDEKELHFGKGLSKAELSWLHASIRFFLIGSKNV